MKTNKFGYKYGESSFDPCSPPVTAAYMSRQVNTAKDNRPTCIECDNRTAPKVSVMATTILREPYDQDIGADSEEQPHQRALPLLIQV